MNKQREHTIAKITTITAMPEEVFFIERSLMVFYSSGFARTQYHSTTPANAAAIHTAISKSYRSCAGSTA
jgi:hypothetical protein